MSFFFLVAMPSRKRKAELIEKSVKNVLVLPV